MNGELIILYIDSHAKQSVTLGGKQCIRRFNWSRKGWIPLSTLGDKALFIKEKDFEITTIDKKDMTNCGVLSNKIYYFFDDGCLIYSIENGELVDFKSISSNEDSGGDLHEYKKKYCTTTFSDTKTSIYWLEPPSNCVCTS